jgi:hypothetical protein
MPQPKQVPTAITVQVELLPPVAHFGIGTQGQQVRHRLGGHVEDMLHDLGLPAAIALTLTCLSVEPSSGPPYRIIVNGRACRLPLRASEQVPQSATALARSIAWDICRNRTLFLTRGIVERVCAQWSGEGAEKSRIDELAALLRELVVRGVGIDAAKPVAVRDFDYRSAPARQLLEDQFVASPNASRISVVLSRESYELLGATTGGEASTGDNESLEASLAEMTDRLFWELGLLVPPVTVTSDRRLDRGEMRVQLNDLRWPPIETPHEEATATKIHFIAARTLEMARRNAASLLTTDAVTSLMDRLHDSEPALTEAVKSRFDSTVLTWILRGLLDEQISIRDLHTVLESLLSIEGSKSSALGMRERITSRDIAYWVDWVRPDLSRQIIYQLVGTVSSLSVDLLAPELEARLAAVDLERLSDDDRQQLLRPVYARAQQEGSSSTIITSLEVKAILRQLIALELPEVVVLAYQELDPNLNIAPRARIGDV